MKKKTLVLEVLLVLTLASVTSVETRANFEPPTLRLSIISPSNTTYNQNSILLNVTFHTQADEYRESQVYYEITGENANYSNLLYRGFLSQNQSIWRNVTITDIPNGNYRLSVGAEYTCGQGWAYADESVVNFTISVENSHPTPTSSPEGEPFPTTLVIGSIIAVVAAVVGLGLLVYFKKRNPKSGGKA